MTEMQQDRSANDPALSGPAGGSKLMAWLQIVRLPNLLTVPGDPLAGFLLAVAAAGAFSAAPWTKVCVAIVISLLLYMCGLIDNDLSDLAEDRRERPGRPLPSGRIKVRAARAACVMSGGAGLCLSTVNGLPSVAVATALLTAIFVYNHAAKRSRIVGPFVMGSCRAMSLMIGAAAAGWSGALSTVVLAAAALLGLYVAAVTLIAAGETRAAALGPRRWLPATVLAAGFGALSYVACAAGLGRWADALLPGGLMSVWAGLVGGGLAGSPPPEVVQACVGRWLRGLLLMQFVFVAVAGVHVLGAGMAFVALWLVNASLAKRFYAT